MEAVQRQISLPAKEITVPETHVLRRVPLVAGIVGLVGLAISGLLARTDVQQFFSSYLVAFLFFVSLAVGSLIFVCIQHVTRAGWSVAVRRVAEHLGGCGVLMLILFLPVLAGLQYLYPWSDTGIVAQDKILQGKAAYLNPTFFVIRALFYLISWSALGWWLRKQSLLQDGEGGTRITRRMQTLSAPSIVLLAVTVTFSAFDWIMSLDPHWYSTIFGVYFFAGAFVSSIAAIILLLLFLQRTGLLTSLVNYEHFHDLGKLLFGFVVFWAYIAFSQFMLIWYANIPEETVWYFHRLGHGWTGVTIALALGHFVVPFFFLLSRSTKRNRAALVGATLWLLLFHYIDLYWLVKPAFNENHFRPAVLDLTTFLGVGGLFIAMVATLARKPLLVPARDPRLGESLSFENI